MFRFAITKLDDGREVKIDGVFERLQQLPIQTVGRTGVLNKDLQGFSCPQAGIEPWVMSSIHHVHSAK